MNIYEQKKATFLNKLSSVNIALNRPAPPSYAQVVGQNTHYGKLCTLSSRIPNFKDLVFDMLEAYNFRQSSVYTILLSKWGYDGNGSSNLPFLQTEPKKNKKKLKYYSNAFDYLSTLNLVEFLSESIIYGDLSEDFIFSLENA